MSRRASPIEFSHDRERLARLQREAKVLASVNHPNVATIYDVVESEGAPPCLILEFVDGSTLAELLANGPFAVDKTLEISQQIAMALEAALYDRVSEGPIYPPCARSRELRLKGIQVPREDSCRRRGSLLRGDHHAWPLPGQAGTAQEDRSKTLVEAPPDGAAAHAQTSQCRGCS